MKIVNLTNEQLEKIDASLEAFDEKFISYKLDGKISIGIEINNKIIAGVYACMTSFKILYVSIVFVYEEYRRKGYGKILIKEMEERAKKLGANTIRLDTFSWQGRDFYISLGYKKVGFYRNEEDDYEEYFFLKRI